MSDAKAIRSNRPIPAEFKEMAKTRCRKCKAEYLIIHESKGADPAEAARQATYVEGYLTGEHVDPKHHAHLDVYEPLD